MSRFVWVKLWVSKSPPTFAWTRWPQRDHSKRFASCKAFLKWFSWSTILDHQIVAISSWNPRKMLLKDSTSLGEISDIHQCFRWILSLRASAGAVYLDFFGIQTFPSSVAHMCRIPPLHRWQSWIFFSCKTLQNPARNGLQPMFKRFVFEGNHAVSLQVKDSDVLCPTHWLEQCSVSILRCKPRIFTQLGWREHPKHISNCQVENASGFSFSFSCIQLPKLSTFAHFAVLERHRVKFRVQNATVGGDGDGDDDSWFMNHESWLVTHESWLMMRRSSRMRKSEVFMCFCTKFGNCFELFGFGFHRGKCWSCQQFSETHSSSTNL